jgi:hypothetical protein
MDTPLRNVPTNSPSHAYSRGRVGVGVYGSDLTDHYHASSPVNSR